ncbi:MAG: PIN domain-containing protein [Candidatus Aminicenantes bacterium]|nr:PIN domain-containing protein [Candidatus Aminicenantes bacterium]
MALFDTDVLIDHLRGNEGAGKVLLRFRDEKNCCSVITSGEILFGMRIEEQEHTLALLDSLEELAADSEIVRLAHDIKIRAKGYRLQLYDCIIAATALKFAQVLVTRNAKHYPDKRLNLYVPGYPPLDKE